MLEKFYDAHVPRVHPNEPVNNVLNHLLKIPQAAIPVVNDDNTFVGEISQRDFLSVEGSKDVFSSEEQFGDIKYLLPSEINTASDLMMKHDVWVDQETSIHDVLRLFINTDAQIIPVLDEERKILGIISDISILKHFGELV